MDMMFLYCLSSDNSIQMFPRSQSTRSNTPVCASLYFSRSRGSQLRHFSTARWLKASSIYLAISFRLDRPISHGFPKVLNLQGNSIGDEGVRPLISGLSPRKDSLTQLDIGNNLISSKGAYHVAEYIKKAESMLLFNISMNDIGDEVNFCLSNRIQRGRNHWERKMYLQKEKTLLSLLHIGL